MAGSPVVLETVTIQSSDGWTAITSERQLFDGVLECVDGEFSVRFDGGTAQTWASGSSYQFLGINLADVEVSTSSGTDVNFRAVGNVPVRTMA